MKKPKRFSKFHPYMIREHRYRWYLVGMKKPGDTIFCLDVDRITSLDRRIDLDDFQREEIPKDLWEHSMGIFTNWENDQGEWSNEPIDISFRIKDGELTIGPDRTGTAMAYGGPVPTPTDAFYVLGNGGSGDAARSRLGLEPVAKSLGLTVDRTAQLIFETACQTILDSATKMIKAINSKPVYTVHELWEGHQVQPKHLLILGGPAPQFASQLQTMFEGKVEAVPNHQVANAIGCALARTTSAVTLFVDTAQGGQYQKWQ